MHVILLSIIEVETDRLKRGEKKREGEEGEEKANGGMGKEAEREREREREGWVGRWER